MAKFTRDLQADGDLTYTKKKSALQKAKEAISNKVNPKTDPEILKKQAELTHAEQMRISKFASDPNKPLEKGEQLKGRRQHNKELAKDMAKYQKELKKQGVDIKGETLTRSKLGFLKKEGGCKDMLTLDEIKELKVEAYEHAAAGNISENMRDALLEYYEAVAVAVEKQEAVMESVEEQRDIFVEYVLDSFNRGMITEKQKDYLMGVAVNENVLYETESGDAPITADELVQRYLEAANDGDNDAKAEIMAKIKAIMEGKECENGSCSIKDKVESLKVNLTDNESKMLDQIDSKIQEKMGKKPEEKTDNSNEDKSEDVSESVRSIVGNGASFDRDELEETLTESVENDIYTEEEAATIRSALDMYYNR